MDPPAAGQSPEGEGGGAELAVTKAKFEEARVDLEKKIGHVRVPSPRSEPPLKAQPARAKSRVVATRTRDGAPRAATRATVVAVKPSLDNQIARFDRLASQIESDMQRRLEDSPLAEGVPPAAPTSDPDTLDELFAEMTAAGDTPAPSVEPEPEPQPGPGPEPEPELELEDRDSDDDVELFSTTETPFEDSPLFVTARQKPPMRTQLPAGLKPQMPPHRPDSKLQPQARDTAAPTTQQPPPRRNAVTHSISSPAGGDRHVRFSVLLRPAECLTPGLTVHESLLQTLREAGKNVSPEDAALAAKFGGAALEERQKQARASPRWIRSNEVKFCMSCAKKFGVKTPKHHCRCCGWTVCGGCSKNTIVLERWLQADKPHAIQYSRSAEALRVCDGCYTHGPGPVTTPASDFIGGADAGADTLTVAAGGSIGGVNSIGFNHSVASAGSGLASTLGDGGGAEDTDGGGIWLQFRFSQLRDFHKEINKVPSSKEVKRMIPKLPPKEAKRRGEAKFAEDFLDERSRAVHAYLSQVLALQSQAQDERDRGGGLDEEGPSKDDLAPGLSADVLGHALRPLLR